MNARPYFAVLCRGLLFSALAGFSLVSHASGSFKPTQTSQTTTIFNWDTGASHPIAPINQTITIDSGGAPKVNQTGNTINIDPSNKSVIIDVEAKIKPKPVFATSALKFAKLLPVIGNVIQLAEFVSWVKDELGASSIELQNNNGQIEAEVVLISSSSYTLWINSNRVQYSNPVAGCQSIYPSLIGIWFDQYSDTHGTCKTSSGGSFGTLFRNKINSGGLPKKYTEPELQDAISNNTNWPDSVVPVIDKMLKTPNFDVPIDPNTIKTSGPASLPGQKITTTESIKLDPGTNTQAAPGTSPTDSGTKTTTTTSTTNITYQGNKVINNSQDKTESSITNNITNITINNNDTKTSITEDPSPPKEDPKDPCEIDPERIGCSKYGTPPEPGELPKKDKNITITPVGFGSVGSCPSPIPFSVFGRSYAMSYKPACDVATYAKTVVLLIASVIAGYVFVGGLKA